MVKKFSKRFRRKRNKLAYLLKKVRTLERSTTPWHDRYLMDDMAIISNQNQQGWLGQNWGLISDWETLITETPMYKHLTASAAGPTAQYADVTTSQLVLNNSPFVNQLSLENTTIEAIVKFTYEIKCNQQTPVYLNVWRVVAKDSHLVDAEDTNSAVYTPEHCINMDIPKLEKYSIGTETLNKFNPMFRLSMITGKRGAASFSQFYKIKSHDQVKMLPGQLIKIVHKQRMRMPLNQWKGFIEQGGTTGIQRGFSFLSGRYFGTLFSLQGTIGRPDPGPGPQGGYLPADLQIIWKLHTKARFHNNVLPSTFSWQDPTLHIGNLKASNIWNSVVQTPLA